MMARIFKAPQKTPDEDIRVKVFLAGSIDMGEAEEWQDMVCRELADLPIDIYNPRRDGWDSSWEQSSDFSPFREQVEWELDHLGEVQSFTALQVRILSPAHKKKQPFGGCFDVGGC